MAPSAAVFAVSHRVERLAAVQPGGDRRQHGAADDADKHQKRQHKDERRARFVAPPGLHGDLTSMLRPRVTPFDMVTVRSTCWTDVTGGHWPADGFTLTLNPAAEVVVVV